MLRLLRVNLSLWLKRLVKKYSSELSVSKRRQLLEMPITIPNLMRPFTFFEENLHRQVILDAEGGLGRYTVEFGKLGYDAFCLI